MESSKSGQMTEGEIVRGVSRLAVLVVVVAAIGCGIYAVKPDVLPSWATDQMARLVSPEQVRRVGLVVVAGLVAVGILVVWSRRRNRRQRRFAASLTAELPAGYNPDRDCRSRRWKHGRPRWVRLRLPHEFPHTDKARAGLAQAVGDRVGVKVEGRWRPGSVMFQPDSTDPQQLARERGRARAAGIGRELFTGACTVSQVTQWGGPDGNSPLAFTLAYPLTTKDDSAAFRRRVENLLGDKLGGRLRGEWRRDQDRVDFRPRPPMPDRLSHPGVEICHITDPRFLPLGVDEDETVVGWDTRTDPHALANGATGSGKTSAIRSAIVAALIKAWEVYLLDPKRVEFSGFRLGARGGWGVKSIATTDEDMDDLLIRLKQIMEDRYAEGEARLKRGEDPKWDETRPILIVLDEFTELVLAMGDLHKARSLKGTPEAVTAVGNLARRARTCNMHLVVLMQRPDADSFPAGARENFTYRFSLNALSEQAARMMWQNSEWGRSLPPVKGRGIAASNGAEPHEVQFYWMPDPAFPADEDRALRDDLMAAAEDVQAAVPATITGADYDLGPLQPSSERDADELVADTGTADEIQLAGGTTAETVRVRAETLTVGDWIVHDDHPYTVQQIEDDPADPTRITIMITPNRPNTPAMTQPITCTVSESIRRIDDLPGGAGDDQPVVSLAEPDVISTDGYQPPPLPDTPTADPDLDPDDDTFRPDEPCREHRPPAADKQPEGNPEPESAEPEPAEPEPAEQPEADPTESESDEARQPAGESEPAESEQPVKPEAASDTAEDEAKSGQTRADHLCKGDRIRMTNRKGQPVAYTVKHADHTADTVGLVLKPARGRERNEDVPATATVDRLSS